jgi:tetratricopeptide (TPR) repeat protein
LLAWYRKLIANKFDGSNVRKSWGRPRVDEETERLVVRMAKENPGWGYDRIVGAMANLSHRLSDQAVGNILRRHDIPPAPKRKETTSWKDFIRAHMAVLVATDFFTVEVLTLRGLITYYVLFFIHLESRRICLAGVTFHPDQEWMEQMARNVTMEDSCFLINRKYLLHDRDSKYCSSFRQVIEALFVGKVDNSDVEDVLKGVQLSNSNPSTMHTLGCVYAEIGKTKEAREVFVQAMDSLNLVEPDDNYWYAFGRIAEQYGEYESAKSDYGRVTKPKQPLDFYTSSYWLAQMRLKAMANTMTSVSDGKR